MRPFIIFAGLAIAANGAQAQQPAPQSRIDAIIQGAKDLLPSVPTLPSISLPSVSNFPTLPSPSRPSTPDVPDLNTFMDQVAATLPILGEMGFEVTTLRVQLGLPPKAKLRLRSITPTDPKKIKEIEAKATGRILLMALVSGAATAKNIQSAMRFGAAIIDVDFALPPKVKLSFLKDANTILNERYLEDLDLACGQAL